MLVEAKDGGYYSKPLWYGTYGENLHWYINRTFDLELRVEVMTKHDKEVKVKISQALNALGFEDFKLAKPEYILAHPFPPSFQRKQCFSFLFTPKGPLPIPQEWDQIFTTPDHDDLVMCWNVPFRTEDIWRFFQKDERRLNSVLGTFVLGKAFVETDSLHVAVRNKIKRQVNLNKVPLDVALEKHGPYIKLKRA